jgi:hypothetical protein
MSSEASKATPWVLNVFTKLFFSSEAYFAVFAAVFNQTNTDKISDFSHADSFSNGLNNTHNFVAWYQNFNIL